MSVTGCTGNGNDLGLALDDRNEMIRKPSQHWVNERWTRDVREGA
jgi:hypothetical protein